MLLLLYPVNNSCFSTNRRHDCYSNYATTFFIYLQLRIRQLQLEYSFACLVKPAESAPRAELLSGKNIILSLGRLPFALSDRKIEDQAGVLGPVRELPRRGWIAASGLPASAAAALAVGVRGGGSRKIDRERSLRFARLPAASAMLRAARRFGDTQAAPVS